MSLEGKTTEVKQILPQEATLPLEGLYLDQRLKELSARIGRPIVISNYVTDIDDVIARIDAPGAAKELKNPSDWQLFQELTAQADIILTGTDYLRRFAELGIKAQNVLTQFDPGGEFAALGEWRLRNGYAARNPDVAVLSRSLDFEIPEAITQAGRKLFVFTTQQMAESEMAKRLASQGATLVGAGTEGVEGDEMLEALENNKYMVIKNTTGPRVLSILLDSATLDRLYITQVQIEIPLDEPSQAVRVLTSGKRIKDLAEKGFALTHEYLQENVTTDQGQRVSQRFLIYDSDGFRADLLRTAK